MAVVITDQFIHINCNYLLEPDLIQDLTEDLLINTALPYKETKYYANQKSEESFNLDKSRTLDSVLQSSSEIMYLIQDYLILNPDAKKTFFKGTSFFYDTEKKGIYSCKPGNNIASIVKLNIESCCSQQIADAQTIVFIICATLFLAKTRSNNALVILDRSYVLEKTELSQAMLEILIKYFKEKHDDLNFLNFFICE